MESKLSYQQCTIFNTVDNPMFIGDTARPASGEGVFQGFGFANTSKGLALDLFYQLVDSFNHLLIMLLPVQIIFPCLICEN